MRLIFMGTPEFAVPALERLIADGHSIAAVFTQPDKPAGRGKRWHSPPVKIGAEAHGLTVCQPARIRNNDEVRETFERIAPDAGIVVAYGKILPEWLLGIPRLGCINVHASLLPKYRGAAPINWAIVRGERETGVTIMQMDAGMDTGPMLAARALPIGVEETAPELAARLSELGAGLLSETLPRIERSELTAVTQDDSAATYAPILKREDGRFSWQMPAREIANRVRGFQPWPGTYAPFRGSKIILWRARQIDPPSERSDAVGRVLAIGAAGFSVACGEGTALHVEEVQIEGKRRVPARDFANGARLEIGDHVV